MRRGRRRIRRLDSDSSIQRSATLLGSWETRARGRSCARPLARSRRNGNCPVKELPCLPPFPALPGRTNGRFGNAVIPPSWSPTRRRFVTRIIIPARIRRTSWTTIGLPWWLVEWRRRSRNWRSNEVGALRLFTFTAAPERPTGPLLQKKSARREPVEGVVKIGEGGGVHWRIVTGAG